MENHSFSDHTVSRSSLFGMDENAAAAAVGAVTLAASFVPYVSYLIWLIPLTAAAVERKSLFARLCDVQNFLCAAVMCACSGITVIIAPYAESAMEDPAGSSLMTFGIIGLIMSLLRVLGLVFIILTSYNGFNRRVFEIPAVTSLIKKIIKYS